MSQHFTPRPYQTMIRDHILDVPRCAIWAGMGMGNVVVPPLVKRYFADRVGTLSTIYITVLQAGTMVPALLAGCAATHLQPPTAAPSPAAGASAPSLAASAAAAQPRSSASTGSAS